MAAQDRTTLESYFETGDKPTQAQFADLIASFLNFKSDFGIFLAHLNQTGVAAPVFSNTFSTLSFTPTWSYTSAGLYVLSSAGNLSSTKVFGFITTNANNVKGVNFKPNVSPNSFYLQTYDHSGSSSDGLLVDASFLMLVIP